MKKTLHLKPAFTLVELLVVIAIIGMLVSLLMPAVQAAREAARRMQCTNHIKQITLSVHNYENIHNAMPVGLYSAPTQTSGNANEDWTNMDEGFGFLAMLLPYLEQSALHDVLDASQAWANWHAEFNRLDQAGRNTKMSIFRQNFVDNGGVRGYNGTPAPVYPGGDTVVSFFKCPTSTLPAIAPTSFSVPGFGSANLPAELVGYATSDYKGCGGSEGANYDRVNADNGVLHKWSESNGPIRFSQITDGLSNTLMVAESSYAAVEAAEGSNDFNGVENWPTWIGAQLNDEQVRINGRFASPINLDFGKRNWFVPREGDSRQRNAVNNDNAYSEHPGGANFGMCDGSVRFISENISQRVYSDLHGRDDGNALGAF
ncbi:MAG: DUF1559 domain-containing protein [Planctomycetaceae bacterium]|nr:DUF1559 domain-containing protein [Planctomycetaceae bacterium]